MTSKRLPHVLYVEDSQGDVALLKTAIEEIGHPVNLDVAFDGESALKRVRDDVYGPTEARPDLILVDLNLPRIDGFDVLAGIRDSRSEIPAAVLTTSTALADRARSLGLGARAVLVKPTTFTGYIFLAHRLKELLLECSHHDSSRPGRDSSDEAVAMPGNA